ncbi:polyprotein [Clonorchis sinensis]|uniref:Polyprotein n=1 Tax=Clonorchis sinensis TaxID=79923 RepID=G7Y749_CLOSI|nr:polyprotein [Clonorchis sinensis]
MTMKLMQMKAVLKHRPDDKHYGHRMDELHFKATQTGLEEALHRTGDPEPRVLAVRLITPSTKQIPFNRLGNTGYQRGKCCSPNLGGRSWIHPTNCQTSNELECDRRPFSLVDTKVREMEQEKNAWNARRLVRVTRATGIRKPPAGETIRDQPGAITFNKEERLDRWAENLAICYFSLELL